LYTHLSSYAGLSALVSSRIHPVIVPQEGILPAVTYHKVSGQRVHTFQADPGVAQPRFRISSWASGYSEAKDVADQIRNALQDFSGVMGGTGGVPVPSVRLENERDKYECETGRYHVDVDFTIFHEE